MVGSSAAGAVVVAVGAVLVAGVGSAFLSLFLLKTALNFAFRLSSALGAVLEGWALR